MTLEEFKKRCSEYIKELPKEYQAYDHIQVIYKDWLKRKEEVEFEDLNGILTDFWPNIGYIEYRNLCKAIEHRTCYAFKEKIYVDFESTWTNVGVNLVYI